MPKYDKISSKNIKGKKWKCKLCKGSFTLEQQRTHDCTEKKEGIAIDPKYFDILSDETKDLLKKIK